MGNLDREMEFIGQGLFDHYTSSIDKIYVNLCFKITKYISKDKQESLYAK